MGLTEAKAAEQYGSENITSYEYNLAGNTKNSILGTAGSVKAMRVNDGPVVGAHMFGARVDEAQLIVNWEAYPEDVAPFIHGTPDSERDHRRDHAQARRQAPASHLTRGRRRTIRSESR